MFNSIKIAFFTRPDTERALERLKKKAVLAFPPQEEKEFCDKFENDLQSFTIFTNHCCNRGANLDCNDPD